MILLFNTISIDGKIVWGVLHTIIFLSMSAWTLGLVIIFGRKSKQRDSDLLDRITANTNLVIEVDTYVKERFLNNVYNLLNKIVTDTMVISRNSDYSKAFIRFLRKSDILHVYSIYKELRLNRTKDRIFIILKDLEYKYILSENPQELYEMFSYLTETENGKYVYDSYPEAMILAMSESAEHFDTEFLKELETFGREEIEIETLKATILTYYTKKLLAWQNIYYEYIPIVYKNFSKLSTLKELVIRNKFKDIFHRIKTINLESEVYTKFVLLESAYNNILDDFDTGIINNENKNIEFNKLKKQILNTLNTCLQNV